MLRTMNLVRVLVLLGLVTGMLGPVSVTPLSAQGPYSEDFNGFTVGATVGSHTGWYDGGAGPVVNASDGVAGSQGLSPATSIFNWTAHPFNWLDASLTGVVIQMDYETDGSAHLDDDRCAWTIDGSSNSSSNQFGVQLDPGGSGYNIETYWRNSSDVGVSQTIANLPGLTAGTWYRFRAEITKLTDSSARIDVTLTQLDSSGNPVSVVASGSIADTSTLGSSAPNSKYFPIGSIWPSYKNFNAIVGEADNAYFEVLTVGATYDISGHILESDDTPIEGVSVTADSGGGSDTTDAAGYYELSVPENWSGTVTPSKVGYTFAPADQSYTNVTADQLDQDYTGTPPAPPAGWVAYNDCVYRSTLGEQYIGSNVTTFGIGSGFTGSTSGVLLDQATGNPTGVTATLTQSGGVVWQADPASGGSDTASGTDAYNTFHTIADMTGVIYYGPTTGWYVDLTLTGLDPAKEYTFATSASRGNSSYTNRGTIYTISGVDAATNASSAGDPGVQEYLGNPLSVWFNTGDNYSQGYVARWTGIDPGADGGFSIRATHHPSAETGYKAYAFDVFMLGEEEAGPPTCYELTLGHTGQGSDPVALPTKSTGCTVDGQYVAGESIDLSGAVPVAGWQIGGWTGTNNNSSTASTNSVTMPASAHEASVTYVEVPEVSAGDVIIAGFQAWNAVGTQDPAEFVSLFNTTDQVISLETMNLISRVDPDGSGGAGVGIDWQLSDESPALTGKSIAPHSFFLIAESDVAAPGGNLHDVEENMDLATGEGGSTERATGLELMIGGVHMDYVLYGRHDGSDGDNPDGDLPFDGSSWPRTEVIRNTRNLGSFQEGLVRRVSAFDLYAGYDVEGFYTDEDVLGDGYPNGVWTSPHSETSGSYEARNSLSPAVEPPVNAPPDQPTLVSPTDDAVGVLLPPELRVNVTDPDGGTLDVTFYGRAAGGGTGEDFRLVVLPDTQNESQYYPAVFISQTQWIANNKTTQNIVFATHVGDIVNTASDATQWSNADAAMDLLDSPNVFYSVGPGNHDVGGLYETYFGIPRFSGKSWYGGYYLSDNCNNYSLFSASGMDFILMNLQYNPTTAMLDWADALLKANSSSRGIVVSHNILNLNDTWSNQAIYDALKDNPNLFLMLCGHMNSSSDGAAYRADLGDDSHTIHSMLADYQSYPNGGNGYLRILRFSPADDLIYATTYSPYINAYITSSPDQMQMAYDMVAGGAAFEVIGTANGISNGANASMSWSGLTAGTEYEWFVEVSDPISTTTSAEWTFTTELPVTEPPVAPTDLGATAVSYSRIDLGWTDNSDNEDSFEIERSTDGVGGPFSPLDTVAANTEECSDTGLDPEAEYCYRVRATNTAGPSGYTYIDCATTPEQPPLICESFNAFTVDQMVGTHADWYDGGAGPFVRASNGVAGSRGLDSAGNIFTWVAQPFDWNDPDFSGINLQMDFETDGSGHFDDDRVGWMIADDSVNSDYIFGVQLDPGGSGYNIEAYWDGDTFGDDGGRTSIANLPALSANAWYRLRAEITRLSATSASIDVTLTQLDGSGNPGAVVASGSIPDTDLLPNTAGEEIPNPGYFTGPIWPAYKNYTDPAAAPADNACYEVVTSGAPVCYALTLGHTGQGSDPVASPTNSHGCTAGQYVAGESIALSGAVPAAGWEIGSWTNTANDSSTASTNSLTMPASARLASVNYTLIPPTCYLLTLGHTGEGVDPVASPTKSDGCSTAGQYVAGESIDLSGALPDTGWQIGSWTGTGDNGSTASTNSLTMPASARAVGVNYTASTSTCYALTLGHSGQGSDPVASPANSTGCDAGYYVPGEDISLTGAVPAIGWEIHSWTGTDDDASMADTNSLTMPASAHLAAVNYTELDPDRCETFESGYTLDEELRVHADWFYEDAHSGPRPTADAGVAATIGLSNGDSIFTWVARPIYWNAPGVLGSYLSMDVQTDDSGQLDGDRIGWMISNTDDDPSNFFGVQLDLGTSSSSIQGYWDGRTPHVVDLPSLSANTWYRVWLWITRLTATSAKVQVIMGELDASGDPWKYIASGTISDTSTLGADAPDPKYFTDPIWPAFQNSTSLSGAADNVCLDVGTTGSIIIAKESDPAGGTGFSFDAGTLGAFSLDHGGSIVFDDLEPGTYDVIETDPLGWDLDSVVCTGGDTEPIFAGPRINCWEDGHQDPMLPTVSDPILLVPDDDEWTEYQESGSPLAGVFATPTENPPVMKFYGIVPNGLYQVRAGLFRDNDLKYYYGFDPADPRALLVDVESGPQGEFSVFDLGTHTVTNTVFSLYTDHADLLHDWGASEFYGWSWIELVPSTAITEGVSIHLDWGETITCTFTNEERPAELGSITIVKETDPAGGTGFSFNAGFLGNFSLDDGENTPFDNLLPGEYTVTEAAPGGWYLDDVVCTGGDWDPATGGATIHLEAGEDIICTFTNESYVVYLPLALKGW